MGSYLLLLIFGAAALLLWGTRMVRTGVTRAFGAEMRRILAGGLGNRVVALGSGMAAAAALQSSTAVALLAASFAKTGLLGTALGLAVMLGADVGSALVAALLTLDIKRFWPVFIFAGYVLHTVYDGRSAKGKQTGRILLGVGLILLALNSMTALSNDLSDSALVQRVIEALAGEPLVAIFLMAILTWIAHSSIAILFFVASLASAGLLADPQLVVTLVLGVNLGGVVPAIMLTLSEPPAARRIALGNGLFKLVAVVAVSLLLPWSAELYAALPGDAGFRTVLLHILLNSALAAVGLWFTGPADALLRRLVAEPPAEEREVFGPLYVASAPRDVNPSLALSSLVRETLRMIDMIETMLRQAMEMLQTGDRSRSAEVHKLDDQVDTLYEAIKSYATALTRQDLEEDESRRAVDILSYATSLENAGDVIDKSLIDTVEKKIKSNASFSPEGDAEIRRIHDYVLETNRLAAAVTMNWEAESAAMLLKRKRDCKRLTGESSELHLARLRDGQARSVDSSSFHLDIIGDLQRVNSFLAGIGYAAQGEDGSQTR